MNKSDTQIKSRKILSLACLTLALSMLSQITMAGNGGRLKVQYGDPSGSPQYVQHEPPDFDFSRPFVTTIGYRYFPMIGTQPYLETPEYRLEAWEILRSPPLGAKTSEPWVRFSERLWHTTFKSLQSAVDPEQPAPPRSCAQHFTDLLPLLAQSKGRGARTALGISLPKPEDLYSILSFFTVQAGPKPGSILPSKIESVVKQVQFDRESGQTQNTTLHNLRNLKFELQRVLARTQSLDKILNSARSRVPDLELLYLNPINLANPVTQQIEILDVGYEPWVNCSTKKRVIQRLNQLAKEKIQANEYHFSTELQHAAVTLDYNSSCYAPGVAGAQDWARSINEKYPVILAKRGLDGRDPQVNVETMKLVDLAQIQKVISRTHSLVGCVESELDNLSKIEKIMTSKGRYSPRVGTQKGLE